jgi:hypothetical protein
MANTRYRGKQMKNFIRSNLLLLCLTACLTLSNSVIADSTSSSLRGKITGPQGNPAPNTKLTIIHNPSGTVRETQTNDVGTFSVKGLRVGGPYTVVIDSEKFNDTMEEGIILKLGEAFRLNIDLKETSQNIETIVVTGSSQAYISTGSNSSFGASEIARAPAFNRDLKDIVKNNPLAVVDESGGLSFGGSNPKYNSITIDGIGQNDDFGLNTSGYPTQRSPISLDAVDQIAVDSSPFTAKVGGFSGGSVNVVTKSGTNEFKGSFFYEFMNEDMAGDPKSKLLEDSDQNFDVGKQSTLGLSFGGPLINDELFFFVSLEQFKKEAPAPFGIGSGSTPSDISQATFDEFSDILSQTYNLTDSLGSDPKDEDDKFLVKLDWNINQQHRADFTFQYQDNHEDRNYTDSDDELKLASNGYKYKTVLRNFASHIYSDWNDDFSTEVSMSLKNTRTDSLTSSNLGEVNVRVPDGDIVFGVDAFRHANVAETTTLKLHLDANYLMGDHEIKFGIHSERLRLYNLFVESSKGVWDFDSLEDFGSKAPSRFTYKNAYDNDPNTSAYEMVRYTTSLYAEDTWVFNDDLDITFGVRYERLSSDDTPIENTAFTNTYGYPNTENLDGLDIFLPRVGFKYYINDSASLRGGIGRYSGGKPNVWVANSFTNDGITFVSAPSSVTNEIINDPNLVDFSKVPQAAKDSLTQGAGSTNSVDPNYKMASDWRFQLGLDMTIDIPYLGEDYQWSIEGNYIKKQDSPFWVDNARKIKGQTADGGRDIYESIYTGDKVDNYDIMLTNADKDGRSILLSTSLQKQWNNGVRMNMSYTNQDITESNPGTSSRAVSNYQYNVALNRNDPLIDTAYYEVEHRFVINLGYTTQFIDGYDTNIDLFFERRSGRPYSYTLGAHNDGDLGDQRDLNRSDIYIPYIPTSATDSAIDWDNSMSYDELMQLIGDAGLSGFAGGYADKNSHSQPWVTTLDLNIQQEIPGFKESHKGMVYFTIDNLANLLNSDWGQVHRMTFPQQILVDYDVNDNGQYVYQERFGGSDVRNWSEFMQEESVWRIKLGLRYNF